VPTEIELVVGAIKAVAMFAFVMQLCLILLWFERKGSALIQDRIGANRAAITGFGARLGLPNLGIINTFVADPIKLFTKEDFVPDGADRFLHSLAPFLALFPVLVTFAVVPFGDTLKLGGWSINLQAADLNVGALYVLATIGIGVYGVALGGWASNNRWALLGGIRATAQMISYELALGLAIISVVMTYGTLDLQEMVRAQGGVWFGWLPRWGVLVQPVALILLMTAGMAESKRVPFDLPEGESELIAGYFTEYSGGKQAAFMLTDFAEIILVAVLTTTFFFGGWQVPYLYPDGFRFPGRVARDAQCGGCNLRHHRLHDQGRVLLLDAGPGAMDSAALSLRSTDASGMEGADTGGPPQRAGNRIRDRILRERALMPLWLFVFLAALSIISALGVIVQRNPVHSLLSLVLTLLAIALLFIGLGAITVGFLQAIIYAGAIMVLFLFVIWLLNLQTETRAAGGSLALKFFGAIAAAALVAEFFATFAHVRWGAGVEVHAEYGSIHNLAMLLFSDYLIAFEVTSILLLAAVVGAVAIARRIPSPQGPTANAIEKA
jgi:NADH-quinone oxidoreductase subunit H